MSNKDNHRRGEKKRTEHGPSWENRNPGAGCNSTHVARTRRWWKTMNHRAERRTGKTSPNYRRPGDGRPIRFNIIDEDTDI